LWKAKIPLKIKIWLWLIWHNAIATKDNMLRRGWSGNVKCQFCNENESILHLFFSCPAAKFVWSCVARSIGAPTRPGSFTQYFWWIPQFLPVSRNVQIAGVAAICWAIWKMRNRACFEGKLIQTPADLICFAVVFMKYWAGLNVQADGDALRHGADIIQQTALSSVRSNIPARLVIEGNRQTSDGGEVDDNQEDAGPQA
jgi:hypothetical protein